MHITRFKDAKTYQANNHDNPATWDDVRSGKLKAFSVGGRGVRVAIR